MAEIDAIVPRLEAELGPAGGPPEPLEGGITNRNYKIRFGERDYVVRLPGKDTALLGIDRRAELLAGRTAAELGIGPEVAGGGEEFLVTEFLICTPVDPGALRADPRPAALALRAFHDSGVELPTRFWVPELLDDYAAIVTRHGGSLPAAYEATRAIAARIAQSLPLSEPVPGHNDLLPANLLVRADGRLALVDWEYAGIGHRYFDLGNLAVNNEFDAAADDRLLEAYFAEPPSDGRRAALALARIMSDAREAAWGVVQGVISELDFDFAAYASKHFARLRAAADAPRFEEWLDAAST
jgi:thiamine kinase-like enzyme